MSRLYFPAAIVARCAEIQFIAFCLGLSASLAFIVFALIREEHFAMSAAILGAVFYGASAGAWIVAEKFK